MSENILEINNINKMFKQGSNCIYAVKNINFTISKGERLYIHGNSGAGKSTLLNILGGISKPSTGKVLFKGKNIYKMSDRKRSLLRNVFFGFIFQFYHLLPELTVIENVMLPGIIKGKESKKDIKKRAIDFLTYVKIANRINHKPFQLSGGEIQRVAIARSLINLPEVLFCDEPTGNLDSEMRQEIYNLIFDISKEKQMSVILVSHQQINKDFFDSEYNMIDGEITNISNENLA